MGNRSMRRSQAITTLCKLLWTRPLRGYDGSDAGQSPDLRNKRYCPGFPPAHHASWTSGDPGKEERNAALPPRPGKYRNRVSHHVRMERKQSPAVRRERKRDYAGLCDVRLHSIPYAPGRAGFKIAMKILHRVAHIRERIGPLRIHRTKRPDGCTTYVVGP